MHKTILLICLLSSLIPFQVLAKPNTSETKLGAPELNAHFTKLKSRKGQLGLYPEPLRIDSQTIQIDSKLPTLLVIYKSAEAKNQKEAAAFLDLWWRHKAKVNFILIDLDKPLTYYSSLLLRQHWKGEPLKVLALSPSGKIRIQLEEPDDLPKLNVDLGKLAAEFAETNTK